MPSGFFDLSPVCFRCEIPIYAYMSTSAAEVQDNGFFRRKFPRRAYSRMVGALVDGKFNMFMASEIGEGGMSLYGDESFKEGHHVVLSFQIPGGDLISIRSVIRSSRNKEGRLTNGLSFETIEFSHKRQIRAFVSARSSDEEAL